MSHTFGYSAAYSHEVNEDDAAHGERMKLLVRVKYKCSKHAIIEVFCVHGRDKSMSWCTENTQCWESSTTWWIQRCVIWNWKRGLVKNLHLVSFVGICKSNFNVYERTPDVSRAINWWIGGYDASCTTHHAMRTWIYTTTHEEIGLPYSWWNEGGNNEFVRAGKISHMWCNRATIKVFSCSWILQVIDAVNNNITEL